MRDITNSWAGLLVCLYSWSPVRVALSSSSSNYVYSFTVSMLCIYGHQHVRVFSDVDCDIASTLSFE